MIRKSKLFIANLKANKPLETLLWQYYQKVKEKVEKEKMHPANAWVEVGFNDKELNLRENWASFLTKIDEIYNFSDNMGKMYLQLKEIENVI